MAAGSPSSSPSPLVAPLPHQAGSEWRSALQCRAWPLVRTEGGALTTKKGPPLTRALNLVPHVENGLVAVNGTSRHGSLTKIFDAANFDANMEPVSTFRTANGTACMDWRGDILANATSKGPVELYIVDPNKPPQEPKIHVTLQVNIEGHPPKLAAPLNELSVPPSCLSLSLLASESDLKLLAARANQLLLWDLSQELSGDALYPTFFYSTKHPSLCARWSPLFNVPHFMVASATSALKLCDTRLMGSEHSPVVWKRPRSHDGLVRDLRWSPFVPFWLATAGEDGVVKVWDLRMNTVPVRTLEDHRNGVLSVDWSPTHADILASGGSDKQLLLWNLRQLPHCLLGGPPSVSSAVNSVAFSWGRGGHVMAVSSRGDFVSVTLNADSLAPHAVSRSASRADSDNEILLQEVEKGIYTRDFSNAFSKALFVAERYRDSGQLREAFQILDVCYQRAAPNNAVEHLLHLQSLGTFTKADFEKELEEVSYFIPPNFPELLWPEVDSSIMFQIQAVKVGLEIEQCIAASRSFDVLAYVPELMASLQRDVNSFTITFLYRVICQLFQYDYMAALTLAIDMTQVFEEQARILPFTRIAHLFLFPTIYEQETSGPVSPRRRMPLSLQSRLNLESPLLRELTKPGAGVCLAQLRLLKEVHLARLSASTTVETLVDLLDPKNVENSPKKHKKSSKELKEAVLSLHIPISFHKTLGLALLRMKRWDRYFLHCGTVLAELQRAGEFDFLAELKAMMSDGFDSFKAHVEDLRLSDTLQSSGVVPATLQLVTILHRTALLPQDLAVRMPLVLQQLSSDIAVVFAAEREELGKKEIATRADNALLQIDRILGVSYERVDNFFRASLFRVVNALRKFTDLPALPFDEFAASHSRSVPRSESKKDRSTESGTGSPTSRRKKHESEKERESAESVPSIAISPSEETPRESRKKHHHSERSSSSTAERSGSSRKLGREESSVSSRSKGDESPRKESEKSVVEGKKDGEAKEREKKEKEEKERREKEDKARKAKEEEERKKDEERAKEKAKREREEKELDEKNLKMKQEAAIKKLKESEERDKREKVDIERKSREDANEKEKEKWGKEEQERAEREEKERLRKETEEKKEVEMAKKEQESLEKEKKERVEQEKRENEEKKRNERDEKERKEREEKERKAKEERHKERKVKRDTSKSEASEVSEKKKHRTGKSSSSHSLADSVEAKLFPIAKKALNEESVAVIGIAVTRATGLPPRESGDKSARQCYAIIKLGRDKQKTAVASPSLSPSWSDAFAFPIGEKTRKELELTVEDDDIGAPVYLGRASISIESEIRAKATNAPKSAEFALEGGDGGQISVTFAYFAREFLERSSTNEGSKPSPRKHHHRHDSSKKSMSSLEATGESSESIASSSSKLPSSSSSSLIDRLHPRKDSKRDLSKKHSKAKLTATEESEKSSKEKEADKKKSKEEKKREKQEKKNKEKKEKEDKKVKGKKK